MAKKKNDAFIGGFNGNTGRTATPKTNYSPYKSAKRGDQLNTQISAKWMNQDKAGTDNKLAKSLKEVRDPRVTQIGESGAKSLQDARRATAETARQKRNSDGIRQEQAQYNREKNPPSKLRGARGKNLSDDFLYNEKVRKQK